VYISHFLLPFRLKRQESNKNKEKSRRRRDFKVQTKKGTECVWRIEWNFFMFLIYERLTTKKTIFNSKNKNLYSFILSIHSLCCLDFLQVGEKKLWKKEENKLKILNEYLLGSKSRSPYRANGSISYRGEWEEAPPHHSWLFIHKALVLFCYCCCYCAHCTIVEYLQEEWKTTW